MEVLKEYTNLDDQTKIWLNGKPMRRGAFTSTVAFSDENSTPLLICFKGNSFCEVFNPVKTKVYVEMRKPSLLFRQSDKLVPKSEVLNTTAETVEPCLATKATLERTCPDLNPRKLTRGRRKLLRSCFSPSDDFEVATKEVLKELMETGFCIDINGIRILYPKSFINCLIGNPDHSRVEVSCRCGDLVVPTIYHTEELDGVTKITPYSWNPKKFALVNPADLITQR